jgi:small subunit ribosomal protein S9
MALTTNNIKVGRRKTATARVRIESGNGKFTINDKEALQFIKVEGYVTDMLDPLKVTGTLGTYDVHVNVAGGGVKGQIGAIKLGIARSLVEINPEFRPALREHGYLTRDPRMVERKKSGRPKARKRFQFSKR